MCSVAGASHVLPIKAAPRYAGCKRTLAVYDPAAAEQRADADAARVSADAGALVPSHSHVAGEPIKAVPLAVSAPKERAEPRWIRARLLPYLRLRFDLPVHFVDEKTVTATDVDPQQNRFRLPIDGVLRNLGLVLSPLDRQAANLLHDETPRPRLPKLPKVPAGAGESKGVRKKRRGRKHGGLPVLAIEYYAGIRELQLTRWESSGVCVIKGEGYMDFINNCDSGWATWSRSGHSRRTTTSVASASTCARRALCSFSSSRKARSCHYPAL